MKYVRILCCLVNSLQFLRGQKQTAHEFKKKKKLSPKKGERPQGMAPQRKLGDSEA